MAYAEVPDGIRRKVGTRLAQKPELGAAVWTNASLLKLGAPKSGRFHPAILDQGERFLAIDL
jgi:hypothetical protein